METPELVKILVSAAIAVFAVAGLWVAFLNFIFGRIDKRFETIHHTLNERFDLIEKLLTARLDNCPTKEDIFELRTQINDVRTQIKDVHSQIDDVRTQIDDVRTQIDDVRTQIDDVRTQIDDVRTQMSKGHETLARKVDDMNAILIKHVEDSTLHPSRA